MNDAFCAVAGRAGEFHPALTVAADISKRTDDELNEILKNPKVSYFDKMEAFMELSKRHSRTWTPAIAPH